MKRREFVKNLAKAGALVGFPTIIPASALGKDGAVAPSNRVNLGLIGVGGMGISNGRNFQGDKRVQITALCDVNNTNVEMYTYKHNTLYGLQAANELFKDTVNYSDYKELLARKDIDAVVNSTPDHWHAIIGIDAINAGKDVYGEKPLTRTIQEGIMLRDTVVASGRIWQTGSWQRSLPNFIHAAELVRNGHIGEIKHIKIGLPGNESIKTMPAEAVPQGFDWDKWQGPAPDTTYHPYKAFTTWRFISDYSSGKIGDWGAHHLDIAHWALGFDNTGPVEITPIKVEWPTEGFYDQPTVFNIEYRYATGLTIEMSNLFKNGVEFFGTKGKLFVSRGALASAPYTIAEKFISNDPSAARLYPLKADQKHVGMFIDSVLDRRITVTDITIAHRSNTVCMLGEIAYRLGRAVKWDPKSEKIVGDQDAARMTKRVYRAPYQLA